MKMALQPAFRTLDLQTYHWNSQFAINLESCFFKPAFVENPSYEHISHATSTTTLYEGRPKSGVAVTVSGSKIQWRVDLKSSGWLASKMNESYPIFKLFKVPHLEIPMDNSSETVGRPASIELEKTSSSSGHGWLGDVEPPYPGQHGGRRLGTRLGHKGRICGVEAIYQLFTHFREYDGKSEYGLGALEWNAGIVLRKLCRIKSVSICILVFSIIQKPCRT